MIEHELFLKPGMGQGDSPFFRVQSTSALGAQRPPFNELRLYAFHAQSIQLAGVENGSVNNYTLSSEPLRLLQSHTLDAFLDVYGFGLGPWRVFQGLALPSLKKKEKLLFAAVHPGTTLLNIQPLQRQTIATIPYEEVLPYGALVSFTANHDSEIVQKLIESSPLLIRQRKNLLKGEAPAPEANAFLHASDYFEGASQEYESLTVLVGILER